jgi:hypothetical protein
VPTETAVKKPGRFTKGVFQISALKKGIYGKGMAKQVQRSRLNAAPLFVSCYCLP